MILVDASSGKRINNIFNIQINQEFGEIIFEPITIPGEYYLYYMPFNSRGTNYPKVNYEKPENTSDEKWLIKNKIKPEPENTTALKNLPKAEVVQFQSIDEFNSFYPMEIIATEKEVNSLLKKNNNPSYLLFPEDRLYPIKMTKSIPYKWIIDGAKNIFKGNADKGEFYSSQVGVYAVKQNIENIKVECTDLIGKKGSKISKTGFQSFNTGGIDWMGNAFKKTLKVEKGNVQSLWLGFQIPVDIATDEYTGEIIVTPDDLPSGKIKITLEVSDHIIPDAGDHEPWRHSRLRWLNSKLAINDDEIIPPYIPVAKQENKITCLGRSVELGNTGLPASVQSNFDPELTHFMNSSAELLASPIRFVIVDDYDKVLKIESKSFKFLEQNQGSISWESESSAGDVTIFCKAKMEFDGYIDFKIKIKANAQIKLKDINLEIPVRNKIAKYMMGMGEKGGYRPKEFEWKWNVKKNHDAVWIGDVNVGLQISFRDEKYSRPLNTNFYLLKPLNMPASWYNEGRGGFSIKEIDTNLLMLTGYSGEREMKSGDSLNYDFSLLVTPFKLLNVKDQFSTRYYHSFKPVNEIVETGANTVNVHHATEINPFINYPFLRPDTMKKYIDEAHQRGLKVKIYYTVRELSNKAPEIFALRSLGDEIFFPGAGGGFSWLQEHFDSNYIAAWFVPELKDAAIINSGVSRWHNYYVEGLNWLVKNVNIDGLYIDDVAFDRTIMKRVRKILDKNRPGALIDLHSANQYNVRDGFVNSANLYMEHFPFLNRLWFGEYFDYDSPPDYWLIEISGVPFGLMGEMLEKGGNPWRGMLYGMTNRLPWAGDPRPIWKVWDEFGIQDSKMIGYWVDSCPVKTNNKNILATVYQKKDRTLISIASWNKNPVNIKLEINWKALGLDPLKTLIHAPFIENFQNKKSLNVGDSISIDPGEGLLLELEQK